MAESLAPGMSRTVEAGDELVITDKDGQEFSVVARESTEVMDFLVAFDAWISTKRAGVTGVVIDTAWAQLQAAWDNLPMRVLSQMPSIKAMTSVRVD